MRKCDYRRSGHHAITLTLEGITPPVPDDEPIAWWNANLAEVADEMHAALRPVTANIDMTTEMADDGTLTVTMEVRANVQREDRVMVDDLKAKAASFVLRKGIDGADQDKGTGGKPDKEFKMRGIDDVYANLRKVGGTPPAPPEGTKAPAKKPPRPPKKGAGA